MVPKENMRPAEKVAYLTQGDAVRITRKFAGLSLARLAKLAGMSKGILVDIETDAAPLYVDQAERLAKALKVSPAALLYPNGDY